MVELADTLDLGSNGYPVQVRVLLPAPKIRYPLWGCRIFYPSRKAWYIITTESCISSAPLGLYLITRQRASSCGLMIYNATHWWYAATSCGWYAKLRFDDIQRFALIALQNYDIILLDKLEFGEQNKACECCSFLTQFCAKCPFDTWMQYLI